MKLKRSFRLNARTLLIAATALSAIPAFAQTLALDQPIPGYQNPAYMVAHDHIVAQFQPGVTSAKVEAYAKRYGLTVDTDRSSPYGYFVVLKLNDNLRRAGVHPGMLAQQLRALPIVQFAEEDGVVTPDYIPNDALFEDCWHLNNTGQSGGTNDADIDAPEGWDEMGALPNVTLAILDDGVDIHHEDLVNSLWVNPGEIPNNGIDDDNNGFIDDVHGWDFVGNDNDPTAGDHGTHCAGIAGATHNNGIGVSGAGPAVRIMAIRFYPGGNYFSDLATAIDYAWKNGAKVISVSYNIDGYNATFRQAVQRSATADAVYVNSAGNNSQQNPPRQQLRNDSDNVIFVVASNDRDRKSSFSNWGTLCEVAAPGEDILSLYPGNQYVFNSGTSMSTPLAAGVAAMIRAKVPELNARETLDALIATSDSVTTLNSFVADGRRVNLHNAMVNAAPPSTSSPISVSVVMGSHTEGNVASFADSDDDSYGVTSVFYTDRGQYSVFDITFNGGMASTEANKMSLTMESRATRLGITQFLQIYNWTTGEWDVLNSGRLELTDAVKEIQVSNSKVKHYINPTDERVIIRCQAFSAYSRNGSRPAPYEYLVDQAKLSVKS